MFYRRFSLTLAAYAFLLHNLTLFASAQAPLLHDPGTPITDEDFNATYTHLVGFEGCGIWLQHDIIQAFWDAAAVLNKDNIRKSQPGDTGINWNLPAAVEYLGSPFNSPSQETIQNFYSHAATFEPSYVHWPTDFKINVRCDDPDDACVCRPSNEYAYTENTGGSNGNGPYLNFCPKFFAQPSLAKVLGRVPFRPPNERYNVQQYSNQAETFMHEMFHIDRVSNAPPNQHVTDLWILTRPLEKLEAKPLQWVQVFGPQLSKVLARTRTDPGQYVLRTAENLMYFAMVTHYQAILHGEYPSRPFCQDVPVGIPQRNRPYSIFDFTDKTLKVSNETAFDLLAQNISPASESCLVEPVATLAAAGLPFAANADYPAHYQSSLSSWMSTWDAYWATQATSSTSTSVITQTTSAKPFVSPKPVPGDSCRVQYKFLLDHFEIKGKDFDAAKFVADGSSLKKQIKGCGALTKWSFKLLTNSDFQWSASGNLPIGTKACVGRAVVSAGGPSPDECTGAG